MVTIRVENQSFRYARADAESIRMCAFHTFTTGLCTKPVKGKFQIYTFKHPDTKDLMFGVERADSERDLLCLTKNGMKEFISLI